MTSEPSWAAAAGLARPHRQWFTVWGLAAVAPFLVLVISFWNTGYTADHGDYAQYILHGRALAEGRPYTDIGYIYTDRHPAIGPRAYSPGLPLTLALVQRVLGPGETPYRVLLLLVSSAGLLGIYLYFIRVEETRLAPGVLLFCGLATGWAWGATRVLTDLVCTALLWAVIYRLDRRRWCTPASVTALGLLGGAAILFRPTALALAPAAVLGVLRPGRERRERVALLILAAVWLTTFVSVNALLPVATSYSDQVSLRPADMIRTGLASAWHFRMAVLESHLYPLASSLGNDLYHGATILLMLLGLGVWFPRLKERFLALFCLCYVGLHLTFSASLTRYLWPLFPIFVFAVLQGLEWLLQRFPPARRRPGLPTLLTLGAASGVGLLVLIGTLRQEPPPAFPRRPDAQELVAWVRDLDPGSRLAVFNPRVLTLHTGVPAMTLFVGSPEDVVDEFCAQGITHAVLGDYGTRKVGQESLRSAVESYPGSFPPIETNGAFELRSFRREGCGAPDPG